MSPAIRVTAVETIPADPWNRRPRQFHDLVPWADPYIVELVVSLERNGGRLSASRHHRARREEKATMTPAPVASLARRNAWRQAN